MEKLCLFTIADLKDWIFDGRPKEGLSERIITPTRAFSFINNPYVTDDMPVVSALYVGNELAAYTAAFPERLVEPDCMTHWFNSLYVSPSFEGKGYGLFVLGSLMECYGDDPIFDLDAVPTSVEILSYLGLQAGRFSQYIFRNKNINCNSLKGKLAFVYDRFSRFRDSHKTINSLKKRIQSASYTLQYDRFIDNEAYEFIKRHAQGNAFLRRRESLNWMLMNPFVHEAPLLDRVNKVILFSSSKEWQDYYVVKVFVQKELAGVYVLCHSSSRLSLLQFYSDSHWEDIILLSIAEHILKIRNPRFSTTDSIVADFVKKNKIYTFCEETPTSICYPKGYESIGNQIIQGGDGDMFLS